VKSRILDRRSKFIALALAGCSPAATRHPDTVAVAPRDPTKVPPGPSASVADPDAGPPIKKPGQTDAGFTIPDGITPETRKRYEMLAERVKKFQERQETAEEELAHGPASWRDFAGEIANQFTSIGWFGYYCPNPPRPETDAFVKMVEDQRKIAQARTSKLKEAAIKKLGKNGEKEFERYSQEYDMANPRPCLSVACDRW
jgi:hypothetical protein